HAGTDRRHGSAPARRGACVPVAASRRRIRAARPQSLVQSLDRPWPSTVDDGPRPLLARARHERRLRYAAPSRRRLVADAFVYALGDRPALALMRVRDRRGTAVELECRWPIALSVVVRARA